MWNPSSDQIELFLDRDRLEVQRIEQDDEWATCLRLLRSACTELSASMSSGRQTSSGHSRGANQTRDRPVRINGYKLFYCRDIRSVSREHLARKSGISATRITKLESVNINKDLGPDCFKACPFEEIRLLEKALRPDTSLAYGKADDFLTFYIEYYKNNWRKPRAKRSPQQDSLFSGRTRAVVFDFGGTLDYSAVQREIPGNVFGNLWDSVWKRRTSYIIASQLVKSVTHNGVTLLCAKLRSAGFSRVHFEKVYENIKPIAGLKETFEELRTRGIEIHIVSGSLRSIIRNRS